MEILAIIVSAVGVAVAAAQLWKSFPRRQLAYDVTAVPLMTTDTPNVDKLDVLYDSKPVAQPYLATFTLVSIGRSDIPEESFSGSKPLLFEMSVPILAHVGAPPAEPHQEVTVQICDETMLAIEPILLPKSLYLKATFLVDGLPGPQAFHRLTDIPVLSAKALREKYLPLKAKVNKSYSRLALGAAGIVLAAAIGVQMFPSLGELNTKGSDADYIATYVAYACLIVVVVGGIGAVILNAAINVRLRPLTVFDRQVHKQANERDAATTHGNAGS